jgi:L-ascorbate metabolism protein UlaG (beta-lactamase superfamily)
MGDSVQMLRRLHWLGHASFRLDGPPAIYIDPYELEGDPPQAGIILVSHEHYDHCSPADVGRICGPDTVIVASRSAARKLRGDVRALAPGERVKLGEIEVEAVPAYNVDKPFHPRRGGHVGFVVTVDSERLYFAGDTDHIPEMGDIECDVALLPVGGTYTMDAEEAARAASEIGPRIAVPMHYGSGIGTPADGARFRSLYAGAVAILEKE